MERDNYCYKAPDQQHEVDNDSACLQSDGGAVYVDVSCKYCGRSGCVGRIVLADEVYW